MAKEMPGCSNRDSAALFGNRSQKIGSGCESARANLESHGF
jgi:hypothetical protein